MKLINQSVEIISDLNGVDMLKLIERIGRECYQSQDKITNDSYRNFVKMLMQRGHQSVIEHGIVSVKINTSRAIANELVRHRICSFSQTSTRYVNYNKKDIEFIKPLSLIPFTDEYNIWFETMVMCERNYKELVERGIKPEIARGVLPLDLATSLVTTTNLREWRHILKIRTEKYAHPDMISLMSVLLKEMQIKIPIVFDDLKPEGG